MKSSTLVILCCLFLFACETPKNQADLQSAPIEVTTQNLPNYWVSQTNAFMLNTGATKTPSQNGSVTLRYLIDKQGNIQNVKVIESFPLGMWDQVALNAVNNLRYKQSVNNPTAQEVYVTTELIFKGRK